MSTKKNIDDLVNNIYPDIDENNKKKPKPIDVEDNYFTTYEVLGNKMTPEQTKQNKNIWTYVIVLVIVIILIFLIWGVVYTYFIKGSENTDEETDYHNLNIGAYITPEKLYVLSGRLDRKATIPTIVGFNLNECPTCKYGDSCKFYTHDPKYYIVGSFDSEYSYTYSGNRNLSFIGNESDKDSCTAICEKNCYGVIYDSSDKTCSLITSSVKATGSASLDFSNTKQMYLKRSFRPQFTDAVIGYSGFRPLRYYLNNDESFNIKKELVRFDIGVVTNLQWCPSRISNYGGKVGYFSTTQFTTSNYLNHDMLYVDNNKGEYTLPLNLQIGNIYILYI